MDCATEESEIRRAVEKITGVQALQFDLAARTLTFQASDAVFPEVLTAIRKAGFDPQPVEATAGTDHDRHDEGAESLAKLLLSLLLAVAAEAVGYFAPKSLPFEAVGMAVAVIAIGLAGLTVYRKGFAALRHGRLNINALMSAAVTGAFAIGQWPEAAMVMALYAIAERIEAWAADRARNAIQGLLALAPETAEVRQADGSWQRVPAADLAQNVIVRVRPGERVPLDGVITGGHSAIDQAPITGESIPVDKAPGDEVFAGTINQTAAIEIRVTAPASDSTLSRIIHAVEQAQSSRAPMQRFVDRFAAIYTPSVFALAVIVAILMPWLFGTAALQAIYKALVLLVIACPCALVISTPVTVVSGLALAARRGILIKGGAYLEAARQLRVIALDKTGTITEGRPQLQAFQPVTDSIDAATLKTWAASLAARSDHPISKAIADGLNGVRLDIEEFSAAPGRGVQGRIGGRTFVLANHRWIEERRQCSPKLEAQLQVHEQQGRSVTLLADEERVLAICAVADSIRATARDAVADLHAMGIAVAMLTGDNPTTAGAVAKQVGIEEVRANLLPEEKLAVIAALQNQHGEAAMVGDGINDAPALAAAGIGFAMGDGSTHIAMEAADVVILSDDLRRLPETIRLSRRTQTILWQNITLALGIKAAFLGLAVFGNATMWMAVFADMGASLLVVLNGLRLLHR
jgi:Cd2+/Zn2+-exporting ATPase